MAAAAAAAGASPGRRRSDLSAAAAFLLALMWAAPPLAMGQTPGLTLGYNTIGERPPPRPPTRGQRAALFLTRPPLQ